MATVTTKSEPPVVALGRAVVRDGRLKLLRDRLGFSVTYMAEILGTNIATYRSWEASRQGGDEVNLWQTTAAKVGRFYTQATYQLDALFPIELRNLVPIHQVAPKLGLPHETLLERYRAGEFEAIDLGVLGLWVRRDQVEDLRP